MKKITLLLVAFGFQLNAQITGTPFSTSASAIREFASELAISGNEVLANGFEMVNIAPPYEGRAFLFEYDGSNLSQTLAFLPDDIALGDDFGKGLDIEGEWIAIGAPGQDGSGIANKGAVYVYRKVGGNWAFSEKLTDVFGTINDRFGSYISIYGDYMFISSNQSQLGNDHSGTVHVYKRNADSWEFTQNLFDSDSYNFGTKTVVKNGRLVTCSQNQAGNQMRFYTFAEAGGSWTLEGTSDLIGTFSPPRDFDTDNSKLYVLYPETTFNGSVATLGLVGDAWETESVYELPQSVTDDFVFGHILVNNGTMVLGAESYILQMPRKFKAKVFHDNSGQWEYVNTLIGTGAESQDDLFGNALAIDGNHLVVGAKNEGFVLPAGKGYFFDLQLSAPDIRMANFKAYPNPTSGMLYLETDNAQVTKSEVFSVTGALLQTSANASQIDLSGLQAGIYFVKAYFEDGSVSNQKVVKR